MPSRIPTRGLDARPLAAARRDYDRTRRDPESKRFYNSAAWKRVRDLKIDRSPLCEVCLQGKPRRLVRGSHVHHVIELRDDPSLGLVLENLQTLCQSCHSRLHASRA